MIKDSGTRPTPLLAPTDSPDRLFTDRRRSATPKQRIWKPAVAVQSMLVFGSGVLRATRRLCKQPGELLSSFFLWN
ncbi:hypothetical protein L596_014433 [Steinernema carpocapsae]|uniref:Uncharacterized protein n=1 Tax=Steinernema carpocapsae TaxID=34508 RepID=A0A4U5NC50_STECR|nr:hypothetical protein L596_014433 [Steinernema carpocapsae]